MGFVTVSRNKAKLIFSRATVLILISISISSFISNEVLAKTPQEKIGVIVLHPKLGMPALVQSWFKKIGKEEIFKRKFQRKCGKGTWICSTDKTVVSHKNNKVGLLAIDLYEDGFLIESPQCAWSKRKEYSHPVDISLSKCVAPRINILKNRGAEKIVVLGNSLGANAAIRAGVFIDGIDAIVAMAPGHTPERERIREILDADIRDAKEKINSGNGQEKIEFEDFNQGQKKLLEVSAENFLSWFDPEGKAVMGLNAPKIKNGTAFLWIAGKDDIISDGTGKSIYDSVPPNPKSKFIHVEGGHRDVRKFGKEIIINWLKTL
jgi:esterase/lipase